MMTPTISPLHRPNRIPLLSWLLAFVPLASAASPVTPGQLSSASTTQSIGIEWALSGDANHDAACTVEYRVSGSTTWQPAMPLIRVDSTLGNTLAGSILFLNPDTRYEVRLVLNDPDGGSDTRLLNVATAPVPAAPTPTRTLHVVPGSGGGDGSTANPYQGFETAWAQAQPGDELLLHAGHYGAVTDENGRSGAAGDPIVFRNAGDGETVFSYIQVFHNSYLWFEGMTFQYDGSSDTGFYSSLLFPGYDNGFQPMLADVTNIVLLQNRFEGFKHSVRAGPRTSRWYIADNTIVGNKQLGIEGTESFDGEGIELGHGSDHEVAFNSITRVGDGVSFPSENCDIYGNDIFDVTDDGVELDTGQANTRMWQNRIHNASHNGVAFQPQSGAPWYILRNQIVNVQDSVLKLRSADRFLIAHNTFVTHGWVVDHWAGQLLRGMTRNNLWISVDNERIWKRGEEQQTWQADHDYDGFDWGTNTAPFNIFGTDYSDLAQLYAGTGLQEHGIRIDAQSCFESFDIPGPPPLTTIPPQRMTLQDSCPAVDAGVVLPNLNDAFTGTAPDMGAFERGQPDPHYGPRAPTPPPPANRPPAADAGPDQNGDEGTAVTLSGASSSDPDGDPLSYSWQQTSGPAAAVVNADQVVATVTLPQVSETATLVFRLTVTDPAGASGNDEIAVTVTDDTMVPDDPPENPSGESRGNGATGWLMILSLAAIACSRRRRHSPMS